MSIFYQLDIVINAIWSGLFHVKTTQYTLSVYAIVVFTT